MSLERRVAKQRAQRQRTSAGSILGVFCVLASLLVVGLASRSLLRASAERRQAEGAYERSLEQEQALQSTILRRANAEDLAEDLVGQGMRVARDVPDATRVDAAVAEYGRLAAGHGVTVLGIDRAAQEPLVFRETTIVQESVSLRLRGAPADSLRLLDSLAQASRDAPVISRIRLGTGAPGSGHVDLMALYAEPPVPASQDADTGPHDADDGDTALASLKAKLTEAIAFRNWAMAVAFGENLLAMDPDSDATARTLYNAHVEWGRELWSLGRELEAREQFEEALWILPSGVEAKAELARIDGQGSESDWAWTPEDETAWGTWHVVALGETLVGLGEAYGVAIEVIVAANDLTDTTIYAGQELFIPVEYGGDQ